MRSALLAFAFCLAATPRCPAQAPASSPPPIQVMVLGVFHFANPNADYAKFQGTDVLTPARQQEIAGVVSQLAGFAPTKIAVERPAGEADSLNGDYRQYLAGRFTLTRNEVHQLGFRLAAQLHHARLYPVDFPTGMQIDSVMAYAHLHDTAFINRFQATITGVVQQLDRMQREETIGRNLRFMNDPATLLLAQQPYMDMAGVGAGDNYVGARVVGQWYDRNLRIFANLTAMAQPGDRILLIIGQGHAPILRDLIRSHPRMQLVEPLAYLR